MIRGLFIASSLGLMIGAAGCSEERAADSKSLIAGDYQLAYRELSDGTILRPPRVRGLMVYTGSHRSLCLYWEDHTGAPRTISLISSYTIDEEHYYEQGLFYAESTEDGQAGLRYDLTGPRGRVPVIRRGGELHFDLPLYDEPELVIDERGITAHQAGAFVDYWRRVE